MPDGDEQLLRAFAGGDAQSFEMLARRYEPALLGLACGLLGGNRTLACDAVQETWLRVIRFAGSFDGRASVKTWLYRIAINQCRTLMKISDAPAPPVATRDTPSALASAETAVKREEVDRLRAAVARLPAERRDVLLLCYHSGLTHDEAAEVLGVPIGTLKSRLHAALETLRSEFATGEDA